MGRRASGLVKISVDLAAEELFEKAGLRQELAVRRRVEPLDRRAQLDQILADVGVAVHRADRSVEKAVRMARRLQHLLAAHVGDLVDLLPEGGRIDVLRDDVVDKSGDACAKLRLRQNGKQSCKAREVK